MKLSLSKIQTPPLFVRSAAWPLVLSLIPALIIVQTPARAQERPAPLRALEKQGLRIVGTFASVGGLTAWAAFRGQQPIALYQTPDGKSVIAGTLLDRDGKNQDQAALEKAVHQPMNDAVWSQLEQGPWIPDGQAHALRTVYVFTDPNCPYCNKFWADARPWVDSGKVQLRHLMVGILTPTSAGKAGALLADKSPAQALDTYERTHAGGNAKALATGHAHPLDDAGLKPLVPVPSQIQTQLDANEKLMAELGIRATPAVVWRDAAGAVQTSTGVPENVLLKILGPR